MSEKKTEEFVVTGDAVVAKVKELIAEGNVRRIIIRDKEDKTLVEFPVTLGVVGVVLAPVLAAVGALAALLAECKIIVERRD